MSRYGFSIAVAALLSSAVFVGSAAAVPLVGTSQANGVVHTLRQIPEACVRLQGQFTGRQATPYALEAVSMGAFCQPRARFVGELTEATTTKESGWRQSQHLQVPAADCSGQLLDFEVWQRDGESGTQKSRDGQGRTRIYLEQSRQSANAGLFLRLPAYAYRLRVTGSCA